MLCRAVDEIVLPGGECEANLALKWMTEVSSAIYATPLITDLYSDSYKDIIVPSFVHYTEVSLPQGAAVWAFLLALCGCMLSDQDVWDLPCSWRG